MECADLWIISNQKSQINSISLRDLKSLFLMKKSTIKGIKLSILEYRFDSPIRSKFAKKYLNMNKRQLQDYWMTRFVNVGQSEPVSKKNFRVIQYRIKKQKNLLSYCFSDQTLDPKLKVISITP
ncbi:hypothetical protein MJH12_01030 [bacterium]|nr:hypothetical protein [bacterium]